MHCDYGGEVTFTACWPDYRLRIQNERGVDILLSKADAGLCGEPGRIGGAGCHARPILLVHPEVPPQERRHEWRQDGPQHLDTAGQVLDAASKQGDFRLQGYQSSIDRFELFAHRRHSPYPPRVWPDTFRFSKDCASLLYEQHVSAFPRGCLRCDLAHTKSVICLTGSFSPQNCCDFWAHHPKKCAVTVLEVLCIDTLQTPDQEDKQHGREHQRLLWPYAPLPQELHQS